MSRVETGELKGKALSVGESVAKTFAYDFESRATSTTGPEISQTNVYNGLDIEAERRSRRAPRRGAREMSPDLSGGIGTRIGSTTNSVAQTYLRDGAYVTDPVLKDSSATYTPGVSERRGTATTFLHSALKNADAQTGTGQTVSGTRRYDAFGNVVTSSGIWNGPFGYAGGFGYQEDATGLKLLGHRYYDSSTGRFLTRDPVMDGRNWYVYCTNNPVGGADPNGLVPVLLIFAVAFLAFLPTTGGIAPGESGRYPDAGQLLLPPFVVAITAVAAIAVLENPLLLLPPLIGDRRRPSPAPSFPPGGRPSQIPENFVESPARKGGGVRYTGPGSKGQNVVRIDPGRPNPGKPAQEVDHVVVISGGQTIGRGGQHLPGGASSEPLEGHIPLVEWSQWPTWNSPK